MSFLAPIFLLGLIGLIVPIVIHLWSKNTKKSVWFGSVRFLGSTETKTMRSIAPSQWLLLLTRIVLLALLVFLLSDLAFTGNEEPLDQIVFIDVQYADDELVEKMQDTLSGNFEMRWLANGFPLVSESASPETPDYWQLLTTLPTNGAEKITVVSPLYESDFSGRGKSIPENIEWMRLPIDPLEKSLIAFKKDDQYFELVGAYDEQSTTYDLTESTKNASELMVTYSITGEAEELHGIFQAAIESLNELSYLTLVESMENPEWRIDLSKADTSHSEKMIFIDANQVVNWKEISKTRISVSPSMTQEEAIEINLPRKLLRVFSEALIDRDINEQLTMNPESFSYKESTIASDENQKSAANYLWILLIIFLILERWMASKSERKAL